MLANIGMDFANLFRENWHIVVGVTGPTVFWFVARYFRRRVYGSRREEKNWFKGLIRSGASSEWKTTALCVKPETMSVEGWSKSTHVKADTVIETRHNYEQGFGYDIRVYRIRLVDGHLTWRDANGNGDTETTRNFETIAGVTLVQRAIDAEGNEVWEVVEKAEEIIAVFKLPTPDDPTVEKVKVTNAA